MKFIKKPIVIEAIQYLGDNANIVMDFVGFQLEVGQNRIEGLYGAQSGFSNYLIIPTLEDGENGQVKQIALPGDWIIKGIAGEFYPCKDYISKETYEVQLDN